jgi:ribosome maturation factor RimP
MGCASPFFICVAELTGFAMEPLEQLLERTVVGLGYELADLEISNRGKMLRVFIDKEHEVGGAGITLDDCTRVTRQLQRVLPVEGVDFDRLEVSSPGLDRKLKKPADFVRFAGQVAEVRLRTPINGRRRVTGTVRGLDGEQVVLDFEGGQLVFDLSNLERARLVPKL